MTQNITNFPEIDEADLVNYNWELPVKSGPSQTAHVKA